jgi:hypothetical protein
VPIVNGFLDAYKAKLAAANAQHAQAAELARAARLSLQPGEVFEATMETRELGSGHRDKR